MTGQNKKGILKYCRESNCRGQVPALGLSKQRSWSSQNLGPWGEVLEMRLRPLRKYLWGAHGGWFWEYENTPELGMNVTGTNHFCWGEGPFVNNSGQTGSKEEGAGPFFPLLPSSLLLAKPTGLLLTKEKCLPSSSLRIYSVANSKLRSSNLITRIYGNPLEIT